MSMNTEQTKGLIGVRNKFVSDRKAIADLEAGTVHTNLDVLSLPDLRYLANFPNIMRNSIVDLELTDDQVQEETSPVFDLSAASTKARAAAQALESLFWEHSKLFNDELKSGFRLESVMAEPKYKTMAKLEGLDIDTVTLRFLSTFDARARAKSVKENVVKHFGFALLSKMYTPGGPALKLDRLIEEGFEGSKDGANPVLFEAIAAQIVDEFTLTNYGELGFVKRGNVMLKFALPGSTGNFDLGPGEMRLVEAGVNPKRFTLSKATEDTFPNVPTKKCKSVSFTGPTLAQSIVKELNQAGGDGKFIVKADLFFSVAEFSNSFGKVRAV
jgi:hypothetical protein